MTYRERIRKLVSILSDKETRHIVYDKRIDRLGFDINYITRTDDQIYFVMDMSEDDEGNIVHKYITMNDLSATELKSIVEDLENILID